MSKFTSETYVLKREIRYFFRFLSTVCENSSVLIIPLQQIICVLDCICPKIGVSCLQEMIL